MEQKRVIDPVWLDFLQHLQSGKVKREHLKMLRTLIVGENRNQTIDFEEPPWNTAILVTPRHAVRVQWNIAALYKHCHANGQKLLVCTAEDTHNGRHLDMREICLLESHRGKHNQKNNHTRTMKDLPYQIEIALGMKIMITDNIQTDLDITNGATGEIIDIILHEDESIQSLNDTIITLKHLPIYILVKLGRTRATKLYNLEDCIVPIEPTSTTYRIKITTQNGNIVQRTIQRRQFPLTGAYAYTDY